jgi:two-component system, chemotaxis family, protein-glutamate methylesterase/glutaminase
VKHDIVVIGASAGGIAAVQEVLSGLPADLPAALFIVIHMPPMPTDLSQVLSRSSVLPVLVATQDQPIQSGNVYVARPDNHLFIENDKILLWQGPKESRHRPSINALFRSAAVNYAQRTVGLILSGTLDDGTTGLWWIQRHGGIVVVQDPSEAQFDEMPQTALNYVDADYVLRLKEIPPLLVRLATGSNPESVRPTGT